MFPSKAAAAESLAAAAAGREILALYIAGPFPRLEPGAAELVILQGSYLDESAAAADILLPETTSFESEGTFVNIEGRAQLSRKAVEPRGDARPGWMVLGELAAKMGRAKFAYSSAGGIREDIARSVPAFGGLAAGAVPPEGVFLAEEEPTAAGFIVGGEAAPGRSAEMSPTVPRDPDDYKGLNLARETKSLRLVRGR
ncbi:MAG: molybdopterin-dependent oxidoreductase [Candidatus Aminicenantales bacterium]